jgi:hypothetical protein
MVTQVRRSEREPMVTIALSDLRSRDGILEGDFLSWCFGIFLSRTFLSRPIRHDMSSEGRKWPGLCVPLPVLTVSSKCVEARRIAAEYFFSFHWLVLRSTGFRRSG